MQHRILNFAAFFLFSCFSYAEDDATLKNSLVSDPIGVADYFQMFLGLAVVVGTIVFMAWLLRRGGHMSSSTTNVLRVISVLSVGAREKVILVKVGEEQVLIGVAPGNIRSLHVLSTPVELP